MGARAAIQETKESEAEKKKKKTGAESSIFSTVLADIQQNPSILHKQQKLSLSAEFSTFSSILGDSDEETPVDFTFTVSQTLTHSYSADVLDQELRILISEIKKTKGQTSYRFVSRNPNYGRGRDRVKEGKVERRGQAKFLGDEASERISRGDLNSEISTDAEDSLCKPEDGDVLESFDEMLSTMLGDESEEVSNAQGGGGIDEFLDEMLGNIENDGSNLERIQKDYVFGELLEDLLRGKLREKSDKEKEENSSCITNGEPQVETRVAEEEKQDERDTEKKSPVEVALERSEQEPTVTKRDYYGSMRRLCLLEKLREVDENVWKRRGKAVRFGMELSYLVTKYMFLIPNELLASEIEEFWIGLKRFGVDGDDKGTSVIIGKLEQVFEMLIWKKFQHIVKLPESIRFDDYVPLCADAIQILGKIVWALRCYQCEQYIFSHLDSQFEDLHKVLMKMELKLAEMKERIFRLVSADYESFSKSERFDGFLRRKLMKRANTDIFGRSAIKYCLLKSWKSLFQADALHEQRIE